MNDAISSLVADGLLVEPQEELASHDPGPGGVAFNRDLLVNSQGIRYREFKRTLKPRYHVVWIHILGGYLALALIAAGVIAAGLLLPAGWAAAAAVAGAVLLGYTFAYLNLFFHEAAH